MLKESLSKRGYQPSCVLLFLKSTVIMQQNRKSNSMNIGSHHTFCTIAKEAVQFV